MDKVDFKKEWPHLYNPSSKGFSETEAPEMQFLMADGHGDPNTAQIYKDVVEALYAVAYKLKFMSKKQLSKDYVVAPLEGLWWADDMQTFTAKRDKSAWDWTMMLMQPDWITPEMFTQAVAEAQKGKELPALSKVRLERYHEGLVVQILHIGSYEAEGPVLDKLHHEYLPQNGYVERGKHHEIYLSDPRKVAPEKLKTILRQPMELR